MSYDPRWHDAANDWLSDCDLSVDLVKKYTPKLAQRLQDVAEEFSNEEIAQLEHDEEEAAYDAHIHRKIDEALGK